MGMLENSPLYQQFKKEALASRFQEVTDRLRQDGRIPASYGVTRPLPEPSSTADFFGKVDELFGLKNAATGGRGTHDGLEGMKTYNDRRREFIGGHEGARATAYDDSTGKPVTSGLQKKGNVTIGVGFNMERPDARNVFSKVLGLSNFDDYYTGKKALTQQQVNTLYDFTLDEADAIVGTKFRGHALTENQRLSMVSLAFNGPALLGPKLVDAVKRGDSFGALNEILFNSLRTSVPGVKTGLAKRRYKEAQMFAGTQHAAMLPQSENDYLARLGLNLSPTRSNPSASRGGPSADLNLPS